MRLVRDFRARNVNTESQWESSLRKEKKKIRPIIISTKKKNQIRVELCSL